MNDSNKIEIGDIVRLKSGGPQMTVDWMADGVNCQVFCIWFSSGGECNRQAFRPTSLVLMSKSS